MNIEILSVAMLVFGVCIAGVNIIVEVLKSFVKNSAFYPLLVLGVSIFTAFFAVGLYLSWSGEKFTPLVCVGTLMGGFFLCYGAMFGYDNLYGEFIGKIEKILKGNNK